MPLFTNEQHLQNSNVHQGDRAPTLNYAKHTPDAPELVTPGANPFYIVHNIQDTARWSMGLLQDGKDAYGDNLRMGDRYFVKSGTCSNVTSVPECQGQTRYIYINNVPTASVPCADPNQPSDPKSAKAPQGLLAGVVQDIVHLNPYELLDSGMGNGSIVNNTCVRRRERVDPILPYQQERPRYETRCAPKKQPLRCSLNSAKQSSCIRYTFGQSDTEENKPASQIRKSKDSDATTTTFATGEKVEAKYKNKGHFLSAVIKKVRGNNVYDVYYADASQSNEDMRKVLDGLSSLDYQFRPLQIIDPSKMAHKPYQNYWMQLQKKVTSAFTDALNKKYTHSPPMVHSHKHCLMRCTKLEDRGRHKWLKMLWTNLYQVSFKKMDGVVGSEGDRVVVKSKSTTSGDNGGNKKGTIVGVNQSGPDDTITYNIRFDDGTRSGTHSTPNTETASEAIAPTPPSDIIELRYSFQVFWTACYNTDESTPTNDFFVGDKVRVKRGGAYVDAKVMTRNQNDTYNVVFYDTNLTQNNVHNKYIQTIEYLIISGDVIGNSYKLFSEEPSGYYIVGVREPFVAQGTTHKLQKDPNTHIVLALFVTLVLCVVIKLFVKK